MADNFNLRSFLTENKLTKNAKLLKEEVSLNGKPVDMQSIEIDGIDLNDYPDFVDAYIIAAEYEDGTPLSEEELLQFEEENYGLVGELIHDRQLYLEEKKQVSSGDMAYTEKAEEGVNESTMTKREKYLTRLVENALGIDITEDDNVDYTMGRQDDPNQLPNPAPELNIPEGEDMVQEKPLPKYENIEKLMQEIEHGTNEAASKHKIMKMKEVAEMLEARVGSLEEGDGAEFVDAKKVKQMKKDIMTLRKQAEKLEKEYDKKFSGKEKKETSKAKKEDVTLAEGTFDLRKFLAENKLTTSSRMLKENVNIEQAFTQAGINLETPATVAINDDLGTIVEYEKFNTGKEALEYVKQEMQSEYLAGELPEIHYEGDIEPSSELEVQPKLEFQFEDADIVIIQA